VKFGTHRTIEQNTIFSVTAEDKELLLNNSPLTGRFHNLVLNHMANMIAAYFFKRNKEIVDNWLLSSEAKQMIAKEISERIILEVKF